MNSRTKRSFLVLGGGISGLTAAQTLHHHEQDYQLLEQCPTLGGLTRTVEVGDFCFDYTGHFLHLCRYSSPEDIPYANLKNDDWARVARRSVCFVGGKFITAPIQYNLAELPSSLFNEAIRSYETRPSLPDSDAVTFRDYMVSGFGQVLSDIFLIPQNEKTMATSLDRLSQSAVSRFFPAPNDRLVKEGMTAKVRDNSKDYNSTFWYPRVGGIRRLVQGLRTGLKQCSVNHEITAIDLPRRLVSTRDKEFFPWDVLLSSIPLKSFCEMTNDPDLLSAAAELTFSSTICFNIGMRSPLHADFKEIHWVYVPDREIPFYRVGFYSNISEGTCAPGRSSMYVEVALRPEEADHADILHGLQRKVMGSLEKLGWLDPRDVACVVTHVIRHAYIHHTREREPAVMAILERLRSFDVLPIGRYGLWDYTSMEDSMESARNAVLELI